MAIIYTLSVWDSLLAQSVKKLPALQETGVTFRCGKDLLEKEMGTHSSILAWRIPWTEEPGGLRSMGLQNSGNDQPPPSYWQYPFSDSDQISPSVMSNSLRPHELQHARPPCPSPTPRVHWDSRPSSQWCHPAISSSVVPFSSCPQSLPASESFPVVHIWKLSRG